MSWLITGAQPFPAVIGEPFGGGFFAGYISHTADGNPTHALIVAPRATGATGSGYTLTANPTLKTTDTATAGATSTFDGLANTAAIVTAGIDNHPAANFCVNLAIGGFTDWYLPARHELDIAYFNLKPSTTANNVSWGINAYSVPRRNANNTAEYPQQTSIAAFNTSSEAFTGNTHWTSEIYGVSAAVDFNFGDGTIRGGRPLTNSQRVRAFRRIVL
jgi:hypothetical protein